ncbi:flocculation protein FLO11-like [Astatotilapia calliptera]|uniref:flocculation protein FLO11-like n=1 Tax=Astatotilapia calliptera TaxID=8154 RepID=UPI000E3FD2F5|nr:flocculation protein FLO11-like [Astatotilapia calliptera]
MDPATHNPSAELREDLIYTVEYHCREWEALPGDEHREVVAARLQRMVSGLPWLFGALHPHIRDFLVSAVGVRPELPLQCEGSEDVQPGPLEDSRPGSSPPPSRRKRRSRRRRRPKVSEQTPVVSDTNCFFHATSKSDQLGQYSAPESAIFRVRNTSEMNSEFEYDCVSRAHNVSKFTSAPFKHETEFITPPETAVHAELKNPGTVSSMRVIPEAINSVSGNSGSVNPEPALPTLTPMFQCDYFSCAPPRSAAVNTQTDNLTLEKQKTIVELHTHEQHREVNSSEVPVPAEYKTVNGVSSLLDYAALQPIYLETVCVNAPVSATDPFVLGITDFAKPGSSCAVTVLETATPNMDSLRPTELPGVTRHESLLAARPEAQLPPPPHSASLPIAQSHPQPDLLQTLFQSLAQSIAQLVEESSALSSARFPTSQPSLQSLAQSPAALPSPVQSPVSPVQSPVSPVQSPVSPVQPPLAQSPTQPPAPQPSLPLVRSPVKSSTPLPTPLSPPPLQQTSVQSPVPVQTPSVQSPVQLSTSPPSVAQLPLSSASPVAQLAPEPLAQSPIAIRSSVRLNIQPGVPNLSGSTSAPAGSSDELIQDSVVIVLVEDEPLPSPRSRVL